MSVPAPPPGFTLESDEAPQQQGIPAPPSGFKLDEEAAAPSVERAPENTWWGAAKGDADAALAMGSRAVVTPIAALGRTLNRVLPKTDDDEKIKSDFDKFQNAFSYDPRTPEGKYALEQIGKVVNPIAHGLSEATGAVVGEENVPAVSDFAQSIPVLGEAGAIKSVAGTAADAAKGTASAVKAPINAYRDLVTKGRAPASTAPLSAEEALARNAAASQGNMGAAAAAPSLEGVSPELKDAIAKASNHNSDALQRHIDADTLPLPEGTTPLRLRKGQAIGDAQQISDEKNMRADPDTQGILSKSITDQDEKLGASMGEIRRRATPDIVQRSNTEHGQAGIDAIKTEDNATVLDTRAKYKALEDAAGGSMPIDTGKTINQITDRLKQKLLTKTAAEEPAISEVMDTLSSGQPISFETFNSALSNLAEVQRNKGSPAAAASVVRNALESMPLTEEAAKLKGLRDIAASAAKKRFDTIEQNPAYEAAVNDNVPKGPDGLHVIGAPSPLADTFMDRHFLGNGASASRAYVERIKKVMGNNPDFSPAIEASSLNKLRDAAGLDTYDNGSFRNASYRNLRRAMDKKADVLMSPASADYTDQLGRVSGYVNDEGKASTVNRSNTALTLQRFGAEYPETPGLAGTLGEYGTDLAATHFLGPVGAVANNVRRTVMKSAKDRKAIESTKAAKLKFAQDATAHGAGIDTGAAPRTTRASGGKVDHEALLNRLIQRWKVAKKMNDAGTETLLKAPDASIIRALDIAQEKSHKVDYQVSV